MNLFNRHNVDIKTAYEKYADLLYRVALSHLASDAEAQDVVQDVFVKYMTKAPAFQDESHEKAWFLRITINRCHDVTRFLKTRNHLPIEEAAHIEATDEHSGSEVMQLLSKVPDKYKDTLILHCLEGYSQEETARLLKISLSAVKMRIKRGRELLMKIRQEEKDV